LTAVERFLAKFQGFGGVRQAGALTYRFQNGALQVLLVRSKTSKRWIFPKGNLEPHLTPSKSAYFEAYEEAGVLGEIEPLSLGAYSYRKRPERGGHLCRVHLYPMKVTQVLSFYPEKSIREREWMAFDRAIDLIQERKLKSILVDFAKRA